MTWLLHPYWRDLLGVGEISYNDFRLKLKDQTSPNTTGEILTQMASKLQPWSFWHGERPPVLVTEEANPFKDIDDDVCLLFNCLNDIIMY